jgi:Kef-type K+ transport system membrane component KefB/glycine cleavage system regulatory protein
MSVSRVLLDVLIVLLAAKLVAEVAERARLPAVVGEIVAGIMIGPSGLALLRGDDVIRTLGELGVILLLFDVGLQMDMDELAAVGRSALAVACIGVALPFAAGLGVGHLLGMSGTEALFVGAALTATSVGITARVFGDLRALASIEARTVLGAAVADDVIGLVILTIVSRIASSGSPSIGDIASTVSIALAFLMLTTLVGVRLVPGLFSLVSRVSRGAGTLVAVGFAFALGVAELANAAKLAPIVGAFIAGLALGRSEAATRVRRELIPVGHLFIPVFFLQIGIDTELGQFTQGHVLGGAAALLVVAVAGKVAAAIGGTRGADRLLVGLGMIPRGEVGLIFAAIGLRQQVFGVDVYATIILVVLSTTLITPPLLRWRLLHRRAQVNLQRAEAEPPTGWLVVRHSGLGKVFDLNATPPATEAFAVGLRAALLADDARPGERLLEWLSSLPEEPLRWDRRCRDLLFQLLDEAGPRAWRFLQVTGLLERSLPELAAAIERRQADAFELDPTGVVHWSRLARLRDVSREVQVDHSERVALAAIILDATEDMSRSEAIVVARRLVGRLELGAAAEEQVAGLIADADLLVGAARRVDAFSEANVLPLAAHIGSVEQCRALTLLAFASGVADDELDRQRVETLREMLEAALSQPGLTGREATNLVSQRTSAAVRLVRDESVGHRIEAAPRPYLLATPAVEVARHATLCEPRPERQEVRTSVAETERGTRVEFVARDRVGLLAAETAALASAGLDVREATIATWGDGCALASFLVQSGGSVAVEELQARVEDALETPPRQSPLPEVRIDLDNNASPWHTLCRVTAPDRPGVLHQVTSVFAACGVSVHSARIASDDGRVVDQFELTDRAGQKLDADTEAALALVLRRGTVVRGGPVGWLRRRGARVEAATSDVS